MAPSVQHNSEFCLLGFAERGTYAPTNGECFHRRCVCRRMLAFHRPYHSLNGKLCSKLLFHLKKCVQAHKRQSIPISKFVTGLSPKSSLVFWTSVFVSTYGSDRSDDRMEGMACSLRMSDDAAVASSRFKTTRKSSSNSKVRNLSLQAAHLH